MAAPAVSNQLVGGGAPPDVYLLPLPSKDSYFKGLGA